MPKAKAFAFHGGWPVKGGDGVGKCLHNGSTSVAGRRGVSPLRGQRNALGRAARTRVQISFFRGGRRRPGTLLRKGSSAAVVMRWAPVVAGALRKRPRVRGSAGQAAPGAVARARA